MRATLITDASFCPKTRAGGWAVWITFDGGVRCKKAGRFTDKPQHSVMAECRAAMNGLAIAYARGARDILLQSDCMAVSTMLTQGKWGFKKAKTLHFPNAVITYRHVKGHTKNGNARSYVNRWCDAEAGQHMRAMREEVK